MKAFLLSVVALCGLMQEVNAHGRLIKPPSREQLAETLLPYQQREPVGLDSTKFVCRDQPAATPAITAAVGSAVTVQWDFTAAHVGDCSMYMSYDVDKPDKEQLYFKLANIADCKSSNRQDINVQIPTNLPPGPAILRFEWVALHVRPMIEYYAQCVDITITNTGAGKLPPNLFKIGPHLPKDGNEYRSGFPPVGTKIVGPDPVSNVELGITLPPVDETREPTSSAQISNTNTPTRSPTTLAPTVPGETRAPSTARVVGVPDVSGPNAQVSPPADQTVIVGAAVSGWLIAVCSLVALVVVVRKQRAVAIATAAGSTYAFDKNNYAGGRQSNQMNYAGNPRLNGDDL